MVSTKILGSTIFNADNKHQLYAVISILHRFLKDHVTLQTGVMEGEN